ncbi:hypothetical protein [Streptomyces sp. CAU 1734]|uniref:hypothetical protein n=1 Tax=Streptomyces sp. CAU 1734 TaxID=3140360 RepID=UPI0032614ED0
MPRRSPGEIRAEQPMRGITGSRQVITGLSAAAHRRIARFEVRNRLWPGSVAHAFRAWERALHSWPGSGPDLGSGTTVWRDGHARTLLGDVAGTMRRKERRVLLAKVARLDDRFLARTLPDPFALSFRPWWRRRIGPGGG